MNDVLNAIQNRCSNRGYAPDKLTAEELDALIGAALQSPTATNRQEIHVTVVDGENPILAEIQSELTGGADSAHNFYYEAPVVLILSAEQDFGWKSVDAGIAAQSIALAAQSLGLGSLIIGCIKKVMYGPSRERYACALGFPEGYGFEIAVVVGHATQSKEPHTYSEEKSVTRL